MEVKSWCRKSQTAVLTLGQPSRDEEPSHQICWACACTRHFPSPRSWLRHMTLLSTIDGICCEPVFKPEPVLLPSNMCRPRDVLCRKVPWGPSSVELTGLCPGFRCSRTLRAHSTSVLSSKQEEEMLSLFVLQNDFQCSVVQYVVRTSV